MSQLCYVTGASGFLGGHICAALLQAGLKVVAVSRIGTHILGAENLRVANYSELAPEKNSILVHLAETNLIQAIDGSRIVAQHALLAALMSKPFSKIIYASSLAVYPTDTETPHREEEDLTCLDTKDDYRRAKLGAERMLMADQGRAHLMLRFVTLYGRGMSPDTLLMTIWKQLNGQPAQTDPSMAENRHITVALRNLNVTRDFLCVQDAAAAVVAAIKTPQSGIFNIGSGEGLRLAQVFDIMVSEMNLADRNPALLESVPGSPESLLVLDITKARELLGWFPKIGFREGIREFLQQAKS